MNKNFGYHNKDLDDLSDSIYYNVAIPFSPDANGFSPAAYQAQLSQVIVDRPEDYFCTVVRFQVPGLAIPIRIIDIQPFPNTNINLTTYSVTLSYAGNFSPQVFVQWVPMSTVSSTPLPLTASHPNVDPSSYYFLFSYTYLLSLFNVALATAFAAIPGGPPVGASPPYFIFDPITERVSLIAQQAFYDLADSTSIPAPPVNPIRVFVNNNAFDFFEGIRAIYNGFNAPMGTNYLLQIQNLNNSNWYVPGPAFTTPATLLQLEQEYATLVEWNSLASIQLVSNLLPINREYVPNFNPNSSIISSQGILSDFIPLTVLGPEARTSIEFVANGPWRLIDMYGITGISKIDLTFYWTDYLGRQFLIDIPIGKNVTCKLLFLKKNAINKYSMKN